MFKLISSICLALILTGCSTSDATKASTDLTTVPKAIPASCELPNVVAAFDAQVKGSKYVPTDWQPAKGTDLYDAIQAGGLACTYGIQVAEIGGTVMWAPNSNGLWGKKKEEWISQGQIPVDIPGIDENDAVILKEGSTSADEMHVWGINLVINGVWIQINASFLQNIEEATPIIQAAIDSLRIQ